MKPNNNNYKIYNVKNSPSSFVCICVYKRNKRQQRKKRRRRRSITCIAKPYAYYAYTQTQQVYARTLIASIALATEPNQTKLNRTIGTVEHWYTNIHAPRASYQTKWIFAFMHPNINYSIACSIVKIAYREERKKNKNKKSAHTRLIARVSRSRQQWAK